MKDLLLVLFTVLLFYLAFPNGGYGFTAWFALVPVIVALPYQTERSAFMLGLLAGTLGWMVSIWWIVAGLADITHSAFHLVLPLVFLFCLFSALPYATVAWLHRRYHWGNSVMGTLKSASLITAMINFIPYILPGNLAHSLYLYPDQIQLAAIGGVALVFFMIHWVNFLLAAGLVSVRISYTQSRKFILIALMVWIGNWGYGTLMVQHIAQRVNKSLQTSLTVAMIQPNFSVKWRTRRDWQQHQQGLSQLLSRVSLHHAIQLIILPEIPMPISYKKFTNDRQFFKKNTQGKALLLTGMDFNGDHLLKQSHYFNDIELVQQNSSIQTYHKQVLLPFGEYLPFEKQWPFLRKLFPNASNYQVGQGINLLSLTVNKEKIRLIPLICYEAVFTNLVANRVKEGGQILINTVDDAWFGNDAGKKIHFALALFRAVEFRMPLVRVSNNGNSAIIEATGHILANSAIPPLQRGYSISNVKIASIESVYQRFPNLFEFICLVFLSIALVVDQTRLYRRSINESK